MINQLFNLYRRHSSKTPLEDFTTEAFIGVLGLNEDIKKDFLNKLLGLPEGDYQIRTQVRYELAKFPNCIVDVVIESETLLCFIENKVNSTEGHEQIKRYGLVLDSFKKNGKETKLVYCTKYHDPKNFKGHRFQQIRWYEVSQLLLGSPNDQIVADLLKFLRRHKMAQRMTFGTESFMALQNMQDTIHLVNEYLDSVKPVFEEHFGAKNKLSDYRTISQVLKHNRLIYLFKDVLPHGGWSEIIYGFRFDTPAVFTSIYVDKKNGAYEVFVEEIGTMLEKGFLISSHEYGTSIRLELDISRFLNDDGAEEEIAEWFKDSFRKFEDMMSSCKKLDWNM